MQLLETLGHLGLELLVKDLLLQGGPDVGELLARIRGDAADALEDDRALRRADQLADLARLKAEGFLLQFVIACRMPADRVRQFAASGRQARGGLLAGELFELPVFANGLVS